MVVSGGAVNRASSRSSKPATAICEGIRILRFVERLHRAEGRRVVGRDDGVDGADVEFSLAEEERDCLLARLRREVAGGHQSRVERDLLFGEDLAVRLEALDRLLVRFRALDESDPLAAVQPNEVGDGVVHPRPVVDRNARASGELSRDGADGDVAERGAILREAFHAAPIDDGSRDDEDRIEASLADERKDVVSHRLAQARRVELASDEAEDVDVARARRLARAPEDRRLVVVDQIADENTNAASTKLGSCGVHSARRARPIGARPPGWRGGPAGMLTLILPPKPSPWQNEKLSFSR